MKTQTPEPVDIHVGARIRLRRGMSGISQQSLAEKLGITFQQVQKYENGSNRVGASRLWAISKALSVPVVFFFEGLESETQFVEPLSTADAKDLGILQQIDPYVRMDIMAVAKRFVTHQEAVS